MAPVVEGWFDFELNLVAVGDVQDKCPGHTEVKRPKGGCCYCQLRCDGVYQCSGQHFTLCSQYGWYQQTNWPHTLWEVEIFKCPLQLAWLYQLHAFGQLTTRHAVSHRLHDREITDTERLGVQKHLCWSNS